MFSFFKKKPPVPAAPPLANEASSTPAAPIQAQDAPLPSEQVISEPHVAQATAEPVTLPTDTGALTPTPEFAPEQRPAEAAVETASAPKHSWTERLKAGLGIHTAAPQAETPAAEAPLIETPLIETPVIEAPIVEMPAAEAAIDPASEITVDTLAFETPIETGQIPEPAPIDTPAAEPPAADIPAIASGATETPPAAALPSAAVAPPVSEIAPPKQSSWTERLKAGLAKTRSKLGKSLAALFGGGKIDEDLYEDLEAVLLTADMGVAATTHLLDDVRERVSLKGLKDASELKGALKDSINELIAPLEKSLDVSGKKPFVIMLAGVNGAGKTTSIGKLAKYYQDQGKSVLLAAGDTFRAAAREQLVAWGERNNVTVISQQGGDSAAVCYDAIQAAVARGIDVVLADTAGRLPTQLHLMEEIKKVKRVIQKALPEAPHEIILVLDANIGQNAVSQVISFDDALQLTGLILTKLDGTAKGGVIAAIASQRPIPLRFIGIGEGIDDLRPFKARDYVDALFD